MIQIIEKGCDRTFPIICDCCKSKLRFAEEDVCRPALDSKAFIDKRTYIVCPVCNERIYFDWMSY